MPEAFKCPTCAAPLDYPAAGGPTMRCPYCNSTVVLPGAQPAGAQGNDIAAILGSLGGGAIDPAHIAELLRTGKKIEVIKIVRQSSGMGLAQAMEVADRLAAGSTLRSGNAPSYQSASVTKVAVSGFKLGFGLLMFMIGLAVIMVTSFAHQARKPVTAAPPPFPIPTILNPLAAPVASTFAHMALEFGTEGIGAGQFKDSRSVAIDGSGHVYVGEYSDGRIQVFDPQGKFIAEWSMGRNKYLSSLVADRHGTVYAVCAFHIFRYEGATGMPLGEMENTREDVEESYTGAFAALNGDIYAVAGNSDIVDLGSDGKIKSSFSAKDKVGEDVSFESIAVLGTGEIYALDRTRGIFKFAPDGRYINRFGGGGEETDPMHRDPAHLTSPNSLAVDGSGRVYVSDDGPAVHVFSGDGRYLDSFGGQDVVFGLSINDQNEIFGCFRNKHSIQKFVLDKP